MDLERLTDVLAERGEPAYRGEQIWQWVARGADGYDAMTNLPASLRAELVEEVPFSTLTL
ncbi:MAG: 23S rRNA (adenine(2503)-C(2))-methyltransferase RlmN, partial [Actinobacteria bacterium]|nr:23S rRNA (adenine(2503)-C(2))-methyltransferase RlmN [Actinomycetota bacterium]